MTREQEIRHECLLQLYGSKEIPISAAHIRKVARRQGFDYSEQEIRDGLFFLRGQGMCEVVRDAATGEARDRITSAGMIEWEEGGVLLRR
jgi:repressor of nif and glnA expression